MDGEMGSAGKEDGLQMMCQSVQSLSWKVRDLGCCWMRHHMQTTNKHTHMCAYICTYTQGTHKRRQKRRLMHNEKRLAACVNNLCINQSTRGANQLLLSHRFVPFCSLHIQSPPAICILNKAAIHIH